MTTGQRIAAKRKELELSQEALGEELGVSRQSIYKWESDASLPDIDKLVALSRRFDVTVGWLLGVEEPPPAGEDHPPRQEELSEQQLRMVEEIARRYLDAQPKPRRRRRWPYVVLVIALLWGGITLFDRLERMSSQYNSLQNSINNISSNVNYQINSISDQVESILKSQNELTAEYGVSVSSIDVAANTATFTAHAVPRTYVEGMQVLFLADHGSGLVEVGARAEAGQKFSGQITCPLSDHISVSAVFIYGDTRQTQKLDEFYGLYSDTLPHVDLNDFMISLMYQEVKDGILPIQTCYIVLNQDDKQHVEAEKYGYTMPELTQIKVGMFKNRKLVTWLTPCEKPSTLHGYDHPGAQFYQLDAMSLPMEEGDTLMFAAWLRDEFGREQMQLCQPYYVREGDEITWPRESYNYSDPDDFTF